MTENTNPQNAGPDKVFEGRLSPDTELGEETLSTDGGAIVPAVPKPIEQDDIEVLRAMYDVESSPTAKAQLWFQIQDHSAQKLPDEMSAFDELNDLGAYKALASFSGRVQAWVETEAI